jgi:DNA primase
LGIEVAGETDSHYLIYCIFHDNHHSPAATIAKSNGFLYCWGAGCGRREPLLEVVKEIKRCDTFPAKRFIKKFEKEKSYKELREEIIANKDEMPSFSKDLLAKFQGWYKQSTKAQKYIASRGITEYSAEFFGLGYDPKKKMVLTPMFDKDGNPVGVVGRSIVQKQFKNSKELPTSKTLFNYDKAKKKPTDTVVICESNFDAIRAWQAGYASVATLGGTFSDYHLTQLNRSFSRIVIGVDVDEAGEKFASKIAKKCRYQSGLEIYRIQYAVDERLPHEAKDFGDCTDDEIAQAIRFAEVYLG